MDPVKFQTFCPDLVPTSRSYTPGVFSEKLFTAQNGAVSRIRFGNRLSNSNLSLTFENITDAQVAQLIEHYYSVMRGDFRAEFSSKNVANGVGLNLSYWILEVHTGLNWKYKGPPQVTSVRPGLSTVSCVFTGELEGS